MHRHGHTIRVLYVFPGQATGSSMIFARKQVEALQACNIGSEVFCLESRTSLKSFGFEAKRFRDRIAAFDPHLVHAQYGTVTAFFSSITTGVPLVVTFRGSDLNPSPSDAHIRSLAGRGLSQLAALRASRIICVSEGLRRRLWWGRKKTVVLPSGVDTQVFFPCPKDKARSTLGWGATERIVVFNAGVSPAVKRLDLARRSVEEAEKLCGTLRLAVLDGRVPQTTVAMMLNGADCLLLTSDWEGSPTIVQEALACNLPVVSVDVGDVRNRLSGVVPSSIVERSPVAIGRALAEMCARAQRSNGTDAIATISQEYIAQRTAALYTEIVAETGGVGRWN